MKVNQNWNAEIIAHFQFSSTFSKILEKLMNSRLVRFLGIKGINYKHQYDFQENKSTSYAILELQSQLINNIEKGLFCCCIFLNFSTAFDTVI